MRSLLLAVLAGVESASTGVCEGPGATLDDIGHCFCPGENTQAGLDASSCECVMYHMEWEDGCIPCSGPGAFVEDGECKCDAALNAALIEDDADKEYLEQTCGCVADAIHDYVWDRSSGFHDHICVMCSGPGATLDDDRSCVCTGYGEVFTVFDEDNGVCSCATNAVAYFHESSQRECCVQCFGTGSALNADTSACECNNGASFVAGSTVECECPAGTIQSGDNCVPCSGVGAALDDLTCTCAENALLADGVCSCDQANGWIHFVAGDDCRTCGLLAVLDQTSGDCVCTDDNSSLDDDVACSCNEGFMLSDSNTCIACSGLGDLVASLTGETCTCADANAELVDGQCQCKIGFLPFGDACVACAGQLTFIDDAGACACPESYVLNSLNQCTHCPSGNLLADSTECDYTLVGGRWVNGVIECFPDYFYYDEEGECVKCTGPGSYPLDGACACRAESLTILSETEPGVCVCDTAKNALDFDDGCKTCTGIGATLVESDNVFECTCGNNAALTWETTGWVCVCNPGFEAGDDGNCYQCDGIFNPTDQSCSCEEPRVLNAAGTGCECPVGSFSNLANDACVVCDVDADLVVGFIDDACVCERNAELDAELGTCSCSAGYKAHEATCVRCELDLTDGECLCPADTIMINYGEQCVDCVGPNAHLVDGVCTCGQFEVVGDAGVCGCADGYQLFGTNCIRCAGLGATLDDSGNCLCSYDNTVPTVTATGLECLCANGFFLASDDTCVACAAPGVFDADSKECVCDDTLFYTANAAGDGCDCADGYSLTSTGTCSKCDTTSDFFFGFFNDECRCAVGASLDADSSCVCDAGYVGHNGVCVLCNEASGAEVVDGVCSCPVGFMIHGASCVACSGLNAKLVETLEDDVVVPVCQCGTHEELVDDVCQCKTDFLEHSEGYCTSCRGVGAELVDDVCTCTDENYTLQLVDFKSTCACKDGLLPADDGNCYVCSLGIFDAATATCSCDSDAFFVLSDDGDSCFCDEGYLLHEDTCVKCDEASDVYEGFVDGVCQCKPGAILIDDSCACGTHFIFDEDNLSCVSCKADSGAFLDGGVCTCPEGFMLFNDACVACAGLGATLDADGVCNCADFATLVDNAADGTAVCECNENYIAFDDVCIMCSGIGATVNEAGLCSCGNGAMLNIIDDLLQCVCPANWIPSGDACFQCDNGVLADDVCTCDAAANLILNADGNGCECDAANWFWTHTSGDCVSCDTTNPLISMFFEDECVCVEHAEYSEGVCSCQSGFVAHDDQCIKCDVDGGSLFDAGVCSCEEGFMLFDGSCIACQGLSAQLVDGVCECGANEVLDNGECVCASDEYMVTSQSTCVRCYGIGSLLDDSDHCVCTGVEGTQFDPILVGKCICEPQLFTFGREKCVQCDAFNYVFNEDTGECFNAAGELVDKSVVEIRAELDTFQVCLMDFFTANLELDIDLQKQILIVLFGIDFTVLEVGGLQALLLSDVVKAQFENINFMSQLNLLIVEEGVDINTATFATDIKAITTPAFFLQTSLTFSFAQFDAIYAATGVTLDALLVQFQLAGAVICTGPGAALNAAGNACECSIPLTYFDDSVFECACNIENGLVLDKDAEACVCTDPTFGNIVGDACVFISLEETKAQLDAYQMCVGNFITTTFDVTDIDAIYRLVFNLDFSTFSIGGFVALLETIRIQLVNYVDVDLVFGQLFSIELVINMISIMVAAGVDITAASFLTDLDAIIVAIPGFWSLTVTTFSFDLFGTFFVDIGLDLSIILAGFEGTAFVPCFGPGAEVIDGACSCSIAFSEEVDGTCGCFTGLNLVDDNCVCAEDYFNLEDDGTCTAWTIVQWEAELDANQMCLANFITNQVAVEDLALASIYQYIFLNLDFTTYDVATGLENIFNADFGLFLADINSDFDDISQQGFCECDNVDFQLFNYQCVSCQVASATVNAEGVCECNDENHLITTTNVCIPCFGDTASLVDDVCTCGDGFLISSEDECIACSGPTAVLDADACACDNVDYQLSDTECVACDAATAEIVAGACECKDANALLKTDNACLMCFGDTATLDNDICTCGANFLLSDDGECIECYGETAELVDGACACDDVDFQLSGSECVACDAASASIVDGVCTCTGGLALLASDNTCVPCHGETATLVDDLCSCDNGFILNDDSECIACSGETAELVDGACVCDNVDYQVWEGECVACDFATAEIVDGECTCKDGDSLLNSANVCVACHGESASLVADVCTCGDTFLIHNDVECIPCSGDTAALDTAGVCTCGDGYILEDDACRLKTEVEWRAELNVFQLCFMSFLESQITITDNILVVLQYVASIDFTAVSVNGLSVIFTETFVTEFNAIGGFDFSLVMAKAEFFSFARLIDIIVIMGNNGVDITSVEFVTAIETAVVASFWTFTVETFSFDIFVDFFASYSITIEVFITAWTEVNVVLCTNGVIAEGVCECTNSIFSVYQCISCSGPTAALVDGACACGTGAAGVGAIELVDTVCTCPANSVVDGETCALEHTTVGLLISQYLSAEALVVFDGYKIEDATMGTVYDLSALSNGGENVLVFVYNLLKAELGAEAAFTLTQSASFSLFVMIVDTLNALSAELTDFHVAYALDIAGLVNSFGTLTSINDITYDQFSVILTGMNAFFTADISAGITAVNTEAIFLNSQESAKVNVGKFCGGFVDETTWGVADFACVCQATFSAVVDADSGYVLCECPADQSQVDGTCVAETEVAALTKSIDISASIVTAYTYTAELSDSSSELFQTYAAEVVSDMTTLMLKSSQVTSVAITVVEFVAVSPSSSSVRRRRQDDSDDAKAQAVIEGEATVPVESDESDIQDDLAETISSATDDDFASLDVESFENSEFEVVTTTTAILSTPSSATSLAVGCLSALLLLCM